MTSEIMSWRTGRQGTWEFRNILGDVDDKIHVPKESQLFTFTLNF